MGDLTFIEELFCSYFSRLIKKSNKIIKNKNFKIAKD